MEGSYKIRSNEIRFNIKMTFKRCFKLVYAPVAKPQRKSELNLNVVLPVVAIIAPCRVRGCANDMELAMALQVEKKVAWQHGSTCTCTSPRGTRRERRRYPGELGESGNLKSRRVQGVRPPILLRAKGRDRSHARLWLPGLPYSLKV